MSPHFRGTIEVFNLHSAANNRSVSNMYVENLTLGDAVLSTALSSGGDVLYATRELISEATTQGSLSVIDVEILKENPSGALLFNTTSAGSPVRIAISLDGTVSVTARESNHLLAFDAEKLISKSNDALVAPLQVGTSPVGLVFAQNETLQTRIASIIPTPQRG